MISTELQNQLNDMADKASSKAEEYTGSLGSFRELIVEHFGENGLIAAYIALGVIVLFVISRVAKIGFSAVKYLVIPAVGVAAVVSFVTPYSFSVTLPVTVTLCSLLLLFKG
ncbi:MAG: hypothetical protein KOO62_08340 [candidate division Zixibacteria bacterium]|nr:hypothetical protein [candidate division Zixibacteria bacterium]